MEPKKYLAEWIDENGAVYDAYEFIAYDYTEALRRTREISWSQNSPSDLIVHRV